MSPFEGGEGRFVSLYDGKIFDTSHAWQTRIATTADIKVGVHVMVPDVKDGKIYVAPKTRQDTLFNRWWLVKVEKVQKDTVIVAGGYEVAFSALRVIK
jgi:hypothetical protein